MVNALFNAVFALLWRYWVPIWQRFPTVVIGRMLCERRNMTAAIPLGIASISFYYVLFMLAATAYQETDLILFAFLGAAWGITFIKMSLAVPILIGRHLWLLRRERRAAVAWG